MRESQSYPQSQPLQLFSLSLTITLIPSDIDRGHLQGHWRMPDGHC